MRIVVTFRVSPSPLKKCLPYNSLPRSNALGGKSTLPTFEAPQARTLKPLTRKRKLPLQKHGPYEAGEGVGVTNA